MPSKVVREKTSSHVAENDAAENGEKMNGQLKVEQVRSSFLRMRGVAGREILQPVLQGTPGRNNWK